MTFSTETIDEITSAARTLGVEPAGLLAIAEVESGGKAFAMVAGRREPLIRFEGHYFDRRLSAQKRQQARAQGLA
ncbi:MAG: N-acetylmuramidase domain-containing protein, partial [Pseudaminobacter sp.]